MAVGEYCYDHIPAHKKPKDATDEQLQALREQYRVQKIIIDNETVCPRCGCDAESEKTKNELNAAINKAAATQKLNIMHEKSLFQDETIKYVKFDTYQPDPYEDEAHRNKSLAMDFVEKYKQGYVFNVIFTGNVGAGKSGLSVSMLKALRNLETSCLFISVRLMFEKIYDSFNNKESIYTPMYFNELLTSVDYLVLDDIGAESGNIDTGKKASEYVCKYLSGILEGRQHKSTIITTNLTMPQMISMYDERFTDRVKRNKKVIKFAETLSFRDREQLF